MAIIGVDVNFVSIAYMILDMNGKLITMGTLPFRGLRRALHLKHMIEDLKRRHPGSWRFLKWLKRFMNRWNKRMRSKLDDACHYIAKKIVQIADEHSPVIMSGRSIWLKEKAEDGRDFRWDLQLWAYGRIQRYIEYKAKLLGLEVVYIDPEGLRRNHQ